MTETGCTANIPVSANWTEDHLKEFPADAPASRLGEIENPEPPENDVPAKHNEGHIPGMIRLDWAENFSDQNEGD